MNNLTELKPRIVLGVAAHPDDLDVLVAGSFSKWAKDGAEVYYLILTDGSKGSDDETMTSENLINLRREEQTKAANTIGAKEVLFLNYPDAMMEVTQELKKDIVKVIRQLKPDVVVCFDPTNIYSTEFNRINHTDHRAAGQATLDAVFPLARDRLTYPELLKEGYHPHKVNTILLMGVLNESDKLNYYVDITHTIEDKLTAISAHASQFNDPELVKNHIKQSNQLLGGKAGVSYAEGFVRLDLA